MKDTPIYSRLPQLLAGMLALSVSLVLCTWIAARAVRDVKQTNDVLVVTGSAKRPIRSDAMIWRLSVSSQQPTAREAYRDLTRQMERVRAYLKEKNVPDDAIVASSIETVSIPEVAANGRETGQILAYRLAQRLEIRSNEIDRYTELSRRSTELIDEGINLTSEPPQYLYTGLDKLRVEMVAEATKDAKARAEAIAGSTGNRVGTVRGARTGVFQITPRDSTEVSDYGIYDTSSIDKDITAVVSITFGID